MKYIFVDNLLKICLNYVSPIYLKNLSKRPYLKKSKIKQQVIIHFAWGKYSIDGS